MLPLLRDAGVELVIMGINEYMGAFPLRRPLFFRWVGPDGRSLLALSGEHYGMLQRLVHVPENSLDQMAGGLALYERKLAAQDYPYDFAYLSLTHTTGWDNNPPFPAAFDLIRRWNEAGRLPFIRFVTPEDLLARAQTLDLPEYRGDWTDYWNFGTGSSARETRLAHAARHTLAAADVAALQRAPARDSGAPAVAREAYAALALWDEHTWGHYASVSDPDRDAVTAAWHLKAAPAYQANALARYTLAEQLEALAGNPRHAATTAGVLLFNPTPFARRDYVRLPRQLMQGQYDHLSPTAHRFAEAAAADNPLDLFGPDPALQTELFGPVEVPAYGYVRQPLSALTLTEAVGLEAGADWLASPTHRLAFDPATGAIRSLVDRRTGREYADPDSPWPLLSLVHETVDAPGGTLTRGREQLVALDFMAFQATSFLPDWPARRTLEQATAVAVRREPHRLGLEVRATLPGAPESVKTVWLSAHTATIGVDVSLRKAEVWEAEALYLALPLDLPGWEAVFDTMGTPTALERDQLPGSCRDWVTASGYVDVHTPEAGLTLACPDMPLAQIGGFTFGQRRLTVERGGRPLLLAWLLNNYWTTNFRLAQPGWQRFHYELATHGGFDPVAAAQVAAFARGPLATHPAVAAAQTESGTLAEVTGAGVVVAAAQRGEAGARVWLQNLTPTPQTATLRLPQRAVQAAARCDTLGAEGAPLPVADGAVTVDVPGLGLVGVSLR